MRTIERPHQGFTGTIERGTMKSIRIVPVELEYNAHQLRSGNRIAVSSETTSDEGSELSKPSAAEVPCMRVIGGPAVNSLHGLPPIGTSRHVAALQDLITIRA
jgi:hypothetical protein